MTHNIETKPMEPARAKAGIQLDRVLFATDFSLVAGAAFVYAAKIAERYHATLDVVHVIDLEPFNLTESESSRTIINQAHEQAELKLNRLTKTQPLSDASCETLVAEGTVAEVLTDLLRRRHSDLVVLGTHGRRALKKLLLGSIAEEVLRMAQCPVLTVGPQAGTAPANVELRHVLYLLRFEPDSSEAATYAVSLAERFAANLTVMNVSEGVPSSAAREEKQQGIIEPFKYWIENHVPEDSDLRGRVRFERGFGSAAEAILSFASQVGVDLIVMPVNRVDPVIAAHLPIPGSVYELITRAHCPVLTIRE